MRQARPRNERGSGLLGTSLGVVVFLSLVMFSTQVLLGLWRRSVVTAVATDAAADIARLPSSAASSQRRAVLDDAKASLGPTGDAMTLDEISAPTDDLVRLRVVTPPMSSLPGPLARLTGVGVVDRVISVHREVAR